MNKRYRKYWGCFLVASLVAIQTMEATPVFERGVLDLRGTQEARWNPISLEGEWEFYWDALLDPKVFKDSAAPAPAYIHVPGNWNGRMVAIDTLRATGCATYRLMVRTDSLYPRMAIYLASLGTAAKVYIDGNLLMEAGKVGTSPENSEPGYRPGVFGFTPRSKEIEIIIQISNFDYARGGFWYNHTLFGIEETVREKHADRANVAALLVGAMLFFAVYMLLLYIQSTKFNYSIYIGLVCFFIALRTLAVNETLILNFIPNLPWEWLIKFEYLSMPGGTLAFMIFMAHFLKNEFNAVIRNVYTVAGGLLILILFVTPARIYTHLLVVFQAHMFTMILYMIYVSLRALRNRREGAMVFFIAFIILAAAITLDLLFTGEYIQSNYPTAGGFVVFIIAMAQMLSARYSRLFQKSERLTHHLEILNNQLETRVEERTRKIVDQNKQLQEKNEEIEKVNDTKDMFFAILAHDLRNPVGAIHQLTEIMEEQFGLFNEKEIFRNIRQIRKSSGETFALLENLLQWALLQKGTLRAKPKRVELLPLVERTFSLLEASALQKGISLMLPEYEGRAVYADEEMITLVVRNLLHNAIKFSSDSSEVQVRISSDDENWKLSVTDFGIGIRKEDQPFLFNLKDKKHTIKGKGQQGTGLGLVLCRDFIQLNNGTMGVVSEEGMGATFYICLPKFVD